MYISDILCGKEKKERIHPEVEDVFLSLLHYTPVTDKTRYPTDPFTILEPQDQKIGEFYKVQERRSMGFKTPKLRKGRSG